MCKSNIVSPCLWKMIGGLHVSFLVLTLSFWVNPTSTALVDFQNCLSEYTRYKQPLALQLVPKLVNVNFDSTNQNNRLNVTVWANVTGSTAGSARRPNFPPVDDTDYWNENNAESRGEIEANPSPNTVNKKTTLYNKIDFMTYKPIREYLSFCDNLINGTCPLGPTWRTDNDLTLQEILPSFGFSYNLNSSFTLRSLAVILKVNYGDKEASEIGCVSLIITPEIDSTLAGIIMYIPVLILVIVGASICLGAIWSPWGSYSAFHWVTNYGQNPDLLRLVTPSLGDCLQYIQFIFLTGGLSINYPGFYQPIVSKLGWSALITKHGFNKNSTGSQNVVDGIYVTHGHHGLKTLSQIIGIAQAKNIFCSMAFWLFVIIVVSSGIIQTGLFIRWVKRQLHHTHIEDLRENNQTYTMGNIIRIVLNYFLLPIVTLSIFQLAISLDSPIYTVALAVLLLLFIIGITLRLGFIISTRPESFFFEDHRKLLLYGSLYNTYSNNAISYALIPVILTLARGIAIGALQASGISQLFFLATCEVIAILSIYGFRPYHSLTSMNAYQISLSTIRLATILLMISFTPILQVPEGTKGWIGYSILFMHFIVLIMAFLLNAIQTIMEVGFGLVVTAAEGGKARGGLPHTHCMRQFSRKRLPSCDISTNPSSIPEFTTSEFDERNLSLLKKGRARSQSSASTQVLLPIKSEEFEFLSSDKFHQNQNRISYQHSIFQHNGPAESIGKLSILTLGDPSHTSLIKSDAKEMTDPFYRPPRFHQSKLQRLASTSKYVKSRLSEQCNLRDLAKSAYEQIEKRSSYISFSDSDKIESRPKADYTFREADLYYKIRGSTPFSNMSGRWSRNSSSPSIEPTKSIAGWFKWIFGGKKTEKNKGFQVLGRPQKPPAMRFRTHPTVEIYPKRTSAMSYETDYDRSGFDDGTNTSAILKSPYSYLNENNSFTGSTECRERILENNNSDKKTLSATSDPGFSEYGLPDDDLELLSGTLLLPVGLC